MVMVAVEAQKAAEDDANELVELNVGRVDGVDDPAHKRQFLLIKSANGKIDKDEPAPEDANEVVTAAEKALLALTTEKTALTEVQVNAIKALAKTLGVDDDELEVQPVPEPARNKSVSKSKGGSMAGSKRVRKHEAEEDDEALEVSDETEEVADDEADDDATADDETDDEEEDEEEGTEVNVAVTARKGSAKAANQRATASSNGPKFKLPTNGKTSAKVPTKAEPGTVTTVKRPANKRVEDDLDERIGLAIAAALGPAMERMTETIAAAITPVQKSGKRPVSKQAEGQDDVRKVSVPSFGDGLFTSAIFPER